MKSTSIGITRCRDKNLGHLSRSTVCIASRSRAFRSRLYLSCRKRGYKQRYDNEE